MKSVEKRTGIKPVPDYLPKYLNEMQLLTYHRLKAFGWHIKFIRRPLFQTPVCILTDPGGIVLAVIEEDGELNKHPDIQFRSDEQVPCEGHPNKLYQKIPAMADALL